MVIVEVINEKLMRHYSTDENMALLQAETGEIYEEAVDLIPCRYTYKEVEKQVEEEIEEVESEPENVEN